MTLFQLSSTTKQRLARWIARPPMPSLLALAAALVVPRHRLGALVVMFDEEGRVLLLEHVFHNPNPWGLPGGWLRRGETPGQAAVRELEEETGLKCQLGAVVLISREIRPSHLTVVFNARLAGGELDLGREILSARWFEPNDLPPGIESFVSRAVRLANECVAPERSSG